MEKEKTAVAALNTAFNEKLDMMLEMRRSETGGVISKKAS